MSLTSALATLVLVVGVPLNVLVTVLLWRQALTHPDVLVLRDRLIAAISVLVLVIVFALIFLNNDTLPPWLATDTTKVITRFVVLGVAVVPALYWLGLWWKGR